MPVENKTLPARKQRHLDVIVNVRGGVEAERIILYGNHARDDGGEDVKGRNSATIDGDAFDVRVVDYHA